MSSLGEVFILPLGFVAWRSIDRFSLVVQHEANPEAKREWTDEEMIERPPEEVIVEINQWCVDVLDYQQGTA